MKKLFALILVLVVALGMFAGCKKRGSVQLEGILDPNEAVPEGGTALSISVYQAGNGIDWLLQTASAYHAENPDVWFYIEGNISLDGMIEGRLNAGTEVSDIFSVTKYSVIEKLIRENKVLDLTEFYGEEIEEGVTLNSLVPDQLDKIVTADDGKKYSVPWFINIGGILYNVKMFEEYGWQIPETMDDLYALCDEINEDTQGNISPITFCGSLGGYFDMLYNIWFSQYAGSRGIAEFCDYASADVYDTPARKAPYEAIAQLISDKSRFPKTVMNKDHFAAQSDFINGEAAMLIGASWVEAEMSEYLADPAYEDFEMSLMPLPKIYASKSADGKLLDAYGEEVKNCMVADPGLLFIPKSSKNAELAKDFLKFFNTKESIARFTRYSGALRPFDYSDISTEGMTPFVKAVVESYRTMVPVSLYSEAEISKTGQAPMHPNNDKFLQTLWNGASAADIVKAEYEYMQKVIK